MTLLPHNWRSPEARFDLQQYELPKVCAVPGCDRVAEAGDGHHVWRRSFGPQFREAWWVEIPEGVEDAGVYPNRVALCFGHHELLTVNQAQIRARLVDGRPSLIYVIFNEDTPNVGAMLPPPVDMQLDIEGGETPHEQVCDHEDEEPCSKCKGTGRIRRRPKERREPGETRPKTTWSVRVPADQRENGYTVLDDLVDAVIDLFHEKGRIRDKNRGAAYYVLVEGLTFVLQHEHLIEFDQPTEGRVS